MSANIKEQLSQKRINKVKQINPVVKKFIVNVINLSGLLFFFYKKLKKPPKQPSKILFISLFFNGDILFHTSVFELVRKIYPDAELHIWIKSRTKEMLKGYPYFKNVIVFNDILTRKYDENVEPGILKKIRFFRKLRNENYDIIYDLTGFFWTAMAVFIASPAYSSGLNFHGFGFIYNFESEAVNKGHLIDKYTNIIIKDPKYIHKLQQKDNTQVPTYYIKQESVNKINELFKQYGIKDTRKKVVLHTTTGWKAKTWDIQNYLVLAELLKDKFDIFLIGGNEDVNNAKIITYHIKTNIYSFAGKIPLNESAEILRRADLYIGADSGPLYLAEAVGTSTISLFGPTNPLFSAPRGAKHSHIYREMFCSAPKDKQNCRLLAGLNCKTVDCMKIITPEEVFGKVIEKLI